MRILLTQIVLIVFVVLTLFILSIKVYQESYIPLVQKRDKTTKSSLSQYSSTLKKEPHVKYSIFPEENQSLKIRYQMIASEIADFRNSQTKLTEQNRTILDTKRLKEPNPLCKTLVVAEKKELSTLRTKAKVSKKHSPRVVIIMDDISSRLQAELLKKLPVKVTPSIFPKTLDHPHTPKIAKLFKHYMVHTPMEAYHFPSPEEDTLVVEDSFEVLEQKIEAIYRDFPKLIAINNHTGSMFTSDAKAMNRLFCILKKKRIRFVDSRTSVETKGVLIGKKYGMKVYERNIFLDNIDDVDAINEKIEETVRYAKKHKLAIAICHPKEATFRALMQAKHYFKGVEVVYMDALYR